MQTFFIKKFNRHSAYLLRANANVFNGSPADNRKQPKSASNTFTALSVTVMVVIVKVLGVATLCLVDKAAAPKVKCKVLTKHRLSSTPITK